MIAVAVKRKPWIPDPTQWEGTWRDDWRIMGQEGYLWGKKLYHMRFDRQLVREDFDQCEFCCAIFDKDVEHPQKAFFEPAGQYWICENCYQDFKEYFGWVVEQSGDGCDSQNC